MRLSEIPVVVGDDSVTGNARAVLREIGTLLKNLLRTGAAGSIDVHGLPLSPADRRWLLLQLGQGEINIVLNIGGRSTIRETGCPGVWWTTHCDEHEQTVGEFIEVASVPDLIPAHPTDMQAGLDRLEESIYRLD